METFTLVVWLSFANPDFGQGFHVARTPSLNEEVCKAAAALVRFPQGSAHRLPDGRAFDPLWCLSTGRSESFTLFVTRHIGNGLQRAFKPGMTESECKAQAELIEAPEGWAWCASSRYSSPERP
jgi:hypothetical protein